MHLKQRPMFLGAFLLPVGWMWVSQAEEGKAERSSSASLLFLSPCPGSFFLRRHCGSLTSAVWRHRRRPVKTPAELSAPPMPPSQPGLGWRAAGSAVQRPGPVLVSLPTRRRSCLTHHLPPRLLSPALLAQRSGPTLTPTSFPFASREDPKHPARNRHRRYPPLFGSLR